MRNNPQVPGEFRASSITASRVRAGGRIASRPRVVLNPRDLITPRAKRTTTALHRYLLAALLFAGASAVQPADASAPTLYDVTTAHSVAAGVPVQPTDVFMPDDRSIYVWYRCKDCTVGRVIASAWLWLEPDPPLEFARGSVAVERIDDFGEFHYELPAGRQWSLGSYRVDLLVDGTPAARVTFTIAAPPTASGARLRAEAGK